MRTRLLILLLAITSGISAQGIRDSVFRISQVEVAAQRSYQKEQAGMKEVRVDTFIMNYQVSADLATLLQENTTVHIKDYGRGALSTASFRGTAPSHTQVTWNGMNINSPMLGMVDFTLVPMFLVDELNIRHGAASIAAQGGGLGGLIAMENQPDWNNTFSGKAYAGIGSFRTSDAFTRVDIGNERVQTKTRVYSNYSKNNYRFVNKNIIERDTVTGALYHPEQENRDAAYRKLGLSQEFYFRLAEQSVLSSHTWMQDASRSVPTVLSNEYSEDGLQRDNIQNDRTLKHVLEFNTWREGSRLEFRSGIDYQLLNYAMQSEITGRDPVQSVNSESRMISWYNHAELRHDITKRFSLKTSASLNRFAISTLDSATLLGYDTTRLEASLMTGLYYSPVDPLQFSAQVRQDMVKGYDTPLIYTFGISARPFGNHDLLLKANLARNYHHPTLNDLYWQPGGNPDLLPEEGHTGELSVSWLKKTDAVHLQTSLTGYYSRISNWILWLPGFKGYWEPLNLREVRSYGMEYHLSSDLFLGEWQLKLNGTFALTHTRNVDDMNLFGETGSGNADAGTSGPEGGDSGEDDSGNNASESNDSESNDSGNIASGGDTFGQQMPFIPKVSGNINAAVMRNGWFVIFQNNSMGVRTLLSSNESRTNSGSQSNSESQSTSEIPTESPLHILYPHYLNHLTLGKRIEQPAGTFTLELKIENLFNESYRNVLMRFMPGRSFTLNMKYDF